MRSRRHRSDPLGGGDMTGCPRGSRELSIGDVEREHMRKDVLRLALDRGVALATDQAPCATVPEGSSSTSLRSRAPMCAIAPAQKTFPTTAASANIDFAAGPSVSRRAAISAWTESGKRHLGAVPEFPTRTLANQQLSVLQEAHELFRIQWVAACTLKDRLPQLVRDRGGLEERRDQTRRLIRRERIEVDRGRVAEARSHSPGRRSSSSGRAVPTMSSGTPSARSATCSRNASSASSAQCRSSNTSTVGYASATCSMNRRHAVKSSSRSAVEVASIPSNGSKRWRNHDRSSPSGRTSIELAERDAGRIGFQDACVCLEDLPQAPRT